MILAAIFLVVVGLVMAIWPAAIWSITEQWKSADATEPSALYLGSTRFGGVVLILIGIAAAALLLL